MEVSGDIQFTEISYPRLLSHVSAILLSCQENNDEERGREFVPSDPLLHMNKLMESLKTLSSSISSLPESSMSLQEIQQEVKSKEQILSSIV